MAYGRNNRDSFVDRGASGRFDRKPRGNRFDRRKGRFNDREGDDNERQERRRPGMFDATCTKCGKSCQVPFRPTGSKPVLCSDCFAKQGNFSRSFSNDRRDMPAQAGISQEQFKELNTKLDKILKVLEELEIEENSD